MNKKPLLPEALIEELTEIAVAPEPTQRTLVREDICECLYKHLKNPLLEIKTTLQSTDISLKNIALNLLKDCFDEEIAHLELRIIRDAQAPRFEALKDTHPEIYADFMKARNGPHELLKIIRDKRMDVLKAVVENDK